MANKHYLATPAFERALLYRAKEDKSLQHCGLWRTCTFSVPASTAEERVSFRYDQYRRKAGAALEQEGFEVLYMGQPFQNGLAMIPVDADRRQYEILAWVRRRPVEMKFWIPDNAVRDMQAIGLTLRD